MRTIDCITQEGIVNHVEKRSISVNIISKSACSGCHSKASCTSMDFSEKQIVVNLFDPTLKEGEKVIVKMRKTLGITAVLLGYGLPFILFITTLIILQSLTKNELISGLGSMGTITLYFVVLKLFTKKLNKTFTFEAERANS